MKKLIGLFLALTLVLSCAVFAFADTGLGNFSAVKEYADGQFTDVDASDWFAPFVEKAFDLGLMEGKGASAFDPDGNTTLAETITVAVKLHSIYSGQEIKAAEQGPWYQSYVDYALANGIITEEYPDYNVKAVRSEYAAILANSMDDDAFAVLSTVEDGAIPDVKGTESYAAAVYKLYRAGILAGSDAAGTFMPESNIKRSEVSTILAKMVDTSLREAIVLKAAGSEGMPNPVVEYSSLEEINEKIGVSLMKPPVMGVTNERFAVIGDTVAQYICDVNGREWTFRAAYVTDSDISGVYSEYNGFTPNQDFCLYTNEFYLERFFDGARQYTIVVTEPGDMGEDVFMDCCMELEAIQKQHMDDPLVGDYQDTVSQRATAYIERFGDTYNISVGWSDSADELTCWTMYNAVKAGDKLTYRGEEICHYTYDAEGNETSSNMTMANNLGYFEIKDGMLYWTGAAQENCRSCVFEKIIYEE